MEIEPKKVPPAAGEAMRPVHRTSVSDEIVAQITELIARNVLKPGDRLPPERELCKRFGVGRSSLREALRSLAVMGVLDGRVGEGTFVCDNSQYLEKALQWGFALDGKKIQDLAETRMMLESQNAQLAAGRATGEDLAAIAAALEGMKGALDDGDRFLESDLQFHLLVARATHNSILYNLLETTRSHLQAWIKGSLSEPALAGRRAELSLREHGRILAALKGRDAAGARRAMADHIRSSGEDLQGQVG
ncbi:MAG: FadR/GntR family transcriptional regulator [Candidatus Latescibacteria bacterium]|jgi:GntR family transcriptional repressor for pyruvate dehydrogenase complex|nr:FadR/GntR family transcriptional regulator [Candidatus Latescibacterota bacterium]